MPKDHSEFPINLTFRVAIAHRDYLDEVASLHRISTSDYLRALLDAVLLAEARALVGVPDTDDDDAAVARARRVLHEAVDGGRDD